MIAGQSPTLRWRENPGGEKRSIEQAVEIARKFGVEIPEDVAFFEDEENELTESLTARGPKVTKPAGSIVYWSELVNTLTHKVPFIVRTDILQSDEAIVGVFGHEMFELRALRGILSKGSTTIEQFVNHTCAGNPGNLHDEAWNHADDLVRRMRKGGL